MITKKYNWKEEIKEEELQEVIKILKQDGVVIFPTDTVYGIACNSLSEKGIAKIFEIKNRPKEKPINVLTDSVEKIEQIANLLEKEKTLMEKYMPGALTMIVEKKESLPSILTSSLPTVGVRIPNNEIALAILKNFPYPLATTSANTSGEEAGVEVEDFTKTFDGKVDAIIDGGPTKIQIASTIIKVEENNIKVLREGSIKITE